MVNRSAKSAHPGHCPRNTDRRHTRHVVGAFVALLLTAPAGRAQVDPPDPALAARVHALVELLGSPRYRDRESATADLCGMGAPAGPLLVALGRHPDPEVRSRVRFVVARLGLLSAEDADEVDRHLGALWIAPAHRRQAALDGALAVSVAARGRVLDALAWPADAVRAELREPVRWVRSGAEWPAPWKLHLTNTCPRPLFVPPAHNRTRATPSATRLVPPRPEMYGGRYGGRMNVYACGKADVLQHGVVLAPGARHAVPVNVPPSADDFVGWLVEHARFDVRAGVRSGRDLLATGPPGTDVATGSVGGSARVLVLPQTDPTEVAGVALAIEAAVSHPTPIGARSLALELVVTHRGAATARIDADWARYTWVALVPHDPIAACPARATTALALAGAPASDAPMARTPHDLAPGTALRCRCVWADVPAGTYRLAAAYEDPSAPDSGYVVGRIIAREVVLAVPADPAR